MTARAYTMDHAALGIPYETVNRTPVFGVVVNGTTRIYTADGTEWERREDGPNAYFVQTARIPQL